MKRVTSIAVLGLTLIVAGTMASAQERLDRTVLPIAEPKRPTYSETRLTGKINKVLLEVRK